MQSTLFLQLFSNRGGFIDYAKAPVISCHVLVFPPKISLGLTSNIVKTLYVHTFNQKCCRLILLASLYVGDKTGKAINLAERTLSDDHCAPLSWCKVVGSTSLWSFQRHLVGVESSCTSTCYKLIISNVHTRLIKPTKQSNLDRLTLIRKPLNLSYKKETNTYTKYE